MSNTAAVLGKKIFAFAKTIIPLVLIILITACGGSGRQARMGPVDLQNYEKVKKLVENRRFEIENQWVYPLRGGAINLLDNPNHIRFKGDSVDVFLPYFGVRQMGGGYGTEGGIKYKGPAKDLDITYNDKERKVQVKFQGQQGTENLQFTIILFSNGNANTTVNSSQRDGISYQGFLGPLPEEAK